MNIAEEDLTKKVSPFLSRGIKNNRPNCLDLEAKRIEEERQEEGTQLAPHENYENIIPSATGAPRNSLISRIKRSEEANSTESTVAGSI